MFLFLFSTIALASQPTKRAPDFERGGNLYKQNCWMCHGELGEGNGPAAASMTTPSPAIAGPLDGKAYNAALRAIMDGKGDMPAYAEVFSREDAKRILKWLEKPKRVKAKKPKTKKDVGKKESTKRKPKKAPSE